MSANAQAAGMFYARKNNRVNAAYLVASALFTTNPSNLDTITINGVVLTFVTGTPSGNQIKIGTTTNATLLALQKFLNDVSNAATNSLFVTAVANVLTVYSIPINANPTITVTASAATVTAATTQQATTRARIPL
jgi:methylglyoxal synthase